ncbi:MAG: hypothetical protein OXC63_04270 [Aestuariivita sp.]|nr:hypothetical protein [Aestuariivita sp.]
MSRYAKSDPSQEPDHPHISSIYLHFKEQKTATQRWYHKYGTDREPAHYHLWSARNEVKPVFSATDRFGIPAEQ